MRKFKELKEGVEAPRAKGEQDFVAAHPKIVTPHPTANDTVHTGSTTPDGEAVKDGEKAPLKTYKDFAQAAPKARKGDKKQGDLTPEKVTEGFVVLRNGEEMEITEDLANKWNLINTHLHLENKAGLVSTALKNKDQFNKVVEFVLGWGR
jgi:hypothetical protein